MSRSINHRRRGHACQYRLHLCFVTIALLISGVAPVTAQAPAAPAGNWHFFSINAQYRGGVKQGFQDLGCGTAFDTVVSGNERRIVFHACVSHPEKKGKYYAMRMDLCFNQAPGQITTTRNNYAWFNEDFPADQRDQVKDMVQLLPMIFSGELLASPVPAININRSQFQIQLLLAKNGRGGEMNLKLVGREPVEGKFFFERNPTGQFTLTKFRLKKGKISTSFVCTDQASITNRFSRLSPFDKLVFGN